MNEQRKKKERKMNKSIKKEGKGKINKEEKEIKEKNKESKKKKERKMNKSIKKEEKET